MDDHPQTLSQDSLPTDAEPMLDSVTAELKAEFARLELEERSCKLVLSHAVDGGVLYSSQPSFRGVQRHLLCRTVDSVRSAIIALERFCSIFGSTAYLQQQMQFWNAALGAALDSLAKLSALTAHSLQASLRTPLVLDGPELSGYKHRLR